MVLQISRRTHSQGCESELHIQILVYTHLSMQNKVDPDMTEQRFINDYQVIILLGQMKTSALVTFTVKERRVAWTYHLGRGLCLIRIFLH